MDDNSFAFLVVVSTLFIVVCIGLPVYLSFRTKWMSMKASPAEAQEMKGLWDTARRMEQRIGYLENVLDTEAPGWRSRSDVR